MNMHKGTLIVIEGIDGSGKTTLANLLEKKFKKDKKEVLLTKEPGGSNLGKMLRGLLQKQPVPISPIAEYFLFAADRAQHILEVVIPALERGAIVISDRMADSSLVYQGYGRGLDKARIANNNAWAMKGITPDLIIYLKIDHQTAATRLATRPRLTVFEKENQEFVERLINGFNDLFLNRKNVFPIDGTQPMKIIAKIAYEKIKSCQQ